MDYYRGKCPKRIWSTYGVLKILLGHYLLNLFFMSNEAMTMSNHGESTNTSIIKTIPKLGGDLLLLES